MCLRKLIKNPLETYRGSSLSYVRFKGRNLNTKGPSHNTKQWSLKESLHTYCLVFNITDLLQLALNGTPFFPEKVYIHPDVILSKQKSGNMVNQWKTCLSVFHPFWNLFSAVAALSWIPYEIILTMSTIEIIIPCRKQMSRFSID